MASQNGNGKQGGVAFADALRGFFGRPMNGIAPGEITLGHTPTPPSPANEPRPQLGVSFGQTGRANYWGLPQWDELNPKLIGPTGQYMFDEMYRTDPDIRRLVLMISSPVQAGSWTLNPFGGDDATDQDREIADTIWWALNQFMRPSFTQHLSEALPLMIRAGYAPFEQIWTTTVYKGRTLTVPKTLQVRLPRSVWRWWQDDLGEMTHIGQIIPSKPDIIIPAGNLVYYRLGGEGDNWMGVSLLRSAYKPWMYKDKLERIDAIGQERKAVGVPIIYPPNNSDPKTRAQVETIFATLHLNEAGYVLMPGPKAGSQGANGNPGEEWLVDVIKFDSSSGESIQASLTYHQLGIAGSFLGDFMQLGHHQVGARATADIQMDPFLTAVDAFAQIGPLPPLNALVDRIRLLNWPDADGSPVLSVNLTDAASLSEISAYVQLLISAGAMQADPELEDWLRERADLPPANADVRSLKEAASEAALKASALQANGPQMNPVLQSPETIAPEAKPSELPSGRKPAGDPTTAPAFPGKGPASPKKLDRWHDAVLSQDKLRAAFDSARTGIETAALPAASRLAEQIASGRAHPAQPDTGELADAIQGEYERLYRVGHQTVVDELAKQQKQLDVASVLGAVGARFGRARVRAENSAVAIANAISAKVAQVNVAGVRDAGVAASQAAAGQLHLEALSNASPQIGDGRYDAAVANGAVAGVYTSVLDDNTCDDCEAADTGDVQELNDLPDCPNPDCQGGDRCRCMIVYLMSDDPSAGGG
jgi:hypothetical protein